MKNLLILLFIARVGIPMGLKATYYDVVSVSWDLAKGGMHYQLTLKDGRTVYVPMMFTVIEEQK